jgi:hypothetical protein
MRSPHLTSLWPHSFTLFTEKMSEVLDNSDLGEMVGVTDIGAGRSAHSASALSPAPDWHVAGELAQEGTAPLLVPISYDERRK